MSNAIVVQQSTDLIEFNDAQLNLIKRTIAKDATNDELDLFLYQCKRTGLDPLARQIHFQKFVGNNGKANVSFITTIDGYRLIADRTNRYAGSKEPVFEGRVSITDGRQYDHDSAPAKATVTVLKIVAGMICEFSSSVYWTEYYPGGTRGHMWRKMPHVMLAKVAEAGALRKAFPQDLSNLYTSEEMEQASPAAPVAYPRAKALPQPSTDYADFVEDDPAPPSDFDNTDWYSNAPADKQAFVSLIWRNVPRYTDKPAKVAGEAVRKVLNGRDFDGMSQSERDTLVMQIVAYAEMRDSGMEAGAALSAATHQLPTKLIADEPAPPKYE